MKCETTNTVLTLVLAVLVVAGVIFALQSIFRTREFRTLQSQIIARQTNLNRLNLLLNESIVYGKTHPDINRIVQPFEAKPVAR
jgi:ABC-type transporter Mla subunit MlaD